MNTLFGEYKIFQISRRFSDYQPFRVTRSTTNEWLSQYEKADRDLLLKLLDSVVYYPEEKAKTFYKERNEKLLSRLNKEGIPNSKVIYVTIHETASSSHVMLNMLRDAGQLERRSCKFIDSRDLLQLSKVVGKLGNGAIIYVDDFAGTGKQFCESRDYVVRNIPGITSNFSEFFLALCICQEAYEKLIQRGVTSCADSIHTPSERLLHPDNIDQRLTERQKNHLRDLSKLVNRQYPLGYENMATMVVIYRNTPNTTPAILRGNAGQDKFRGILPRTTDLPVDR